MRITDHKEDTVKRSVVGAMVLAAGLALAAWVGGSTAQAHEAPGSKTGAVHQEAAAAGGEQMAGHSHEKCERHGGEVTMTKGHHFEAVWVPEGLRIYIYGENQAPLDVEKAAGTVTFRFKDGTSKDVALVKETPVDGEVPTVYFCPMHPDVVQMQPGTCPKCGGMKLFTQDRLTAKVDLSHVAADSMKAVVKIAGLAGPLKTVTFTQAFTGLKAPDAGTQGHKQG